MGTTERRLGLLVALAFWGGIVTGEDEYHTEVPEDICTLCELCG